jgi:hypothetical protein
MSARFRIRTSGGQELSFASHDVFAEFVRSGDLSPDDVVYDAETREWSSARTHPVVLQIELEAEDARRTGEAEQERAAAEAPELPQEVLAPSDLAPSLPIDAIGLDLAPAPELLSPEQASAAFVAKMEAERAADMDPGTEAPLRGFTMEEGASVLAEKAAEPAAPRPPVRHPEPVYHEPDRWGETPAKAKSAQKKEERKSASGFAPFMILLVLLAGAGIYFGPELLERGSGVENAPPPDRVVGGTPTPPPLIADNEDEIRERSQERFLSATQTALRGLDPIPEIWLRGSYLAAPSDYPNVRVVWEEYLTTIREVRAGDDERYRAAYLRTLDDARVDGSARTLRLASATTDFQAAAAARNAHYDRVEALATVALQGHDALVRAEGTIAYEPASGAAVSADPVIEAAGRSPEAQTLLEQVLDLVLTELQGSGGPGEAANVREWVYGGLLDAVTN